MRCGGLFGGRFEHVPVSLCLAIHGSKSPRKAHHTSPPTTDITFLTRGENQKPKKIQRQIELYPTESTHFFLLVLILLLTLLLILGSVSEAKYRRECGVGWFV